MKTADSLKIALAFSGGGYRAAAFSLGVLTYLNKVEVAEGNLLQSVSVLSTVSGGTITGARYAVGVKSGESLQQIYQVLYNFMCKTDLVSLALDRLISKEGWEEGRVKSLINAVADVYDIHLFKQKKFALLLSEQNPVHLKHICFNATDFANALQFRFQSSEKILKPEQGEPEQGIVGNHFYRVPLKDAAEIRLADILAASSCFPGGFEPINFPTDFALPKELKENLLNTPNYPVGLMDGGIVDNQGITPILLAENRIKRNFIAAQINNEGKALDLVIVSDVASPYMEAFQASYQQKRWSWQTLTPGYILTVNTILILSSLAALFLSIREGHALTAALAAFLFTVSLIIFLVGYYIKRLPRKFQVPPQFLKPLGKLLRLELFVYDNLILNRTNSLLKMTGDVFLKHIRRLNYQTIFNDKEWINRRIMNAIYELREGEDRIKNKVKAGSLSPLLLPSPAIEQVAAKASAVGTTLWFTAKELQNNEVNGHNTLDTVIACGQFTMCWNLLEYIGKIKMNNQNTKERHQALIASEPQLLEHWERLKKDPYWLVKVLNKKQ